MHPTLSRTFATVALLGIFTATSGASEMTATFSSGHSPLLATAFQTFLDGQQRWAYQETVSFLNADGALSSQSLVSIDPSQPYDQQRVPVKINDRPPTEKQLQDWAKAGEAAAKRRLATPEAKASVERDQDFRLQLINREVKPLFDLAKAIAEDATSVTYEIPMREIGGTEAALVDDHRLTVRVNRQHQVFEHATLLQTKTIRIAAGKYSEGIIEVEFAEPGERYQPVPVRISSTLTNKPMFGPAHPSKRRTERKDFRPVTPYDERFKVKLAPLRLIEF